MEAMIALFMAGIITLMMFKTIEVQNMALLCEIGQVTLGCRAVVLRDIATGCQYIVSAGAVTPRTGVPCTPPVAVK